MNRILSFLRQASWIVIQHFASRGIGVLVFYGISLYVVPEDLGLMGLAWIFVAVCDALLGLGMPTAFLRKTSVDDLDKNTLFWGMAGAGLVWTVVCMGLAPIAAAVFDHKVLLPVILVLSLRFPLRALDSVPLSINIRNLQFKRLALLEIACTSLSGGIGIFLAYKGFGVWSLVMRHVIHSAISTTILYAMTDWRPARQFSKVILKEYLAFGIPLTLSGNVGWLLALQVEQAVVGGVLGPAALGILNFAKKPLDVGGQVIASVRETVLLPLLVKRKRETGSANRLALSMYLGASGAAVALVLFAAYIFPYQWFTESRWQDAFVLMPIFSVIFGFRMVQQVFLAHLTFLGEVKFLLLSALFETGLYCGLLFVFTKQGLERVADCMLIAVLSVVAIFFFRLAWQIRLQIREKLATLWRGFAAKA
ncbi:oligosaccharide flippase family protein [Pelagicoccus albus]|uniref:Oligosaccharide flippase family protein n=1 Tax=Pelagicoccus albus TaxID=415222 RepID=A0A7X1B8D4_9BACT|nr:oligosaccharide flippase family protein [Pelagicoccus albus]